jgi:dihydroflavonol-4-reductase
MPTLLTGGTGLLGANVVRALNARNLKPRVLVREHSDRRGLRGASFEPVLGDVLEPASLAAALEGVDAVYHLAGATRFDPFSLEMMQRVHVEGTRNVVETAAAQGVRRLVHVSSIVAVGHGTLDQPATEDTRYNFAPGQPYHESKRAAEELALSAGAGRLDVVVVNPSHAIGPHDVHPAVGELLLLVARGVAAFYPSGGTNFVNAQDVAEGIVLAMEKGRPRERYILGGENLSYRAFLSLCAEEAGVRPPLLPLPQAPVRVLGKLGDLVGRLSPERFAFVNSAFLQAVFLPAYCSSDKAVSQLGYRPRALRRGVREAYRWFQEEGFLPRTHALQPSGVLER